MRHPKTRTRSLSGDAVRRQKRPAIGQKSPTLGAARTESGKRQLSRKQQCRVVEVLVRQPATSLPLIRPTLGEKSATIGQKSPALGPLEEQLLATGRKSKSLCKSVR